MSSQSACNNIVPQTPLQTHHLFTPRSPQLACVALAPAVTRTLAQRPGNVVIMPTIVVSKRNAYSPVTMISTSHENPEELKKNKQRWPALEKDHMQQFRYSEVCPGLSLKCCNRIAYSQQNVCGICCVYASPGVSAGSALHMQSIRCV